VTPSQRLITGALALATLAGGYAAGRTLFRPASRIRQPILFNHKIHVGDAGIECVICHDNYPKGEHAGLPGLSTCTGCHTEASPDQPEIAKLLAMVKEGKEDVFRKLFRLSDHVFYSHRRHAGIGKLPCEGCHGAIAATQAPPERPLVRIDMAFCVNCHEQKDISVDCTRCHR
jgi:hypothetical protein